MSKKVKNFLHKFFKIFIIFMLAILVINVIVFVGLYINHRSKCKKEAVYMHAPGEMVNIDGKNIHVLEGGDTEADTTLVFIHDGLVCDDSIALQPLFDELSGYHLVYVDKSGYGFSPSSDSDKHIDAMVDDYRKVLQEKGIEGPYVLVASGTGGLDAVYWADTYKDEVQAIIGMDMNYAEQFDSTTTDEYTGFFDYLMIQFTKIGGMRLAKSSFPDNIGDVYSDVQMKTRDAIIAERGYTRDMYFENYYTVDNAAAVKELGMPEDIPMYMLMANPLLEPYINDDETAKTTYEEVKAKDEDEEFDYVAAYCSDAKEFYSQYDNITCEEMSGPARLYTYDPKGVAERISGFIEENIK